MNVWAVGAGGFFGAIVRYLAGKALPTPAGFPLGTLSINLIGCLFLAWFFTITTNRWRITPSVKLAIGTGFTGAFTTFSTFSVETLTLIHNQEIFLAILYVLLSILGGIGFALLGAKLAAFHMSRVGQSKGGIK